MFSGLSTELKDLSRLFMHYNKFQAATNQVENIIGDDKESNVIYEWRDIEINELEFKYNDETKTTIYIPKFKINRGEKISIVGKTAICSSNPYWRSAGDHLFCNQ